MCKSRRFRPRARTAKVADLRMCKSRHFSVCTCVQSRHFSDPRRKTFVQVVCGLVVTRRTKLFVAQSFPTRAHHSVMSLCPWRKCADSGCAHILQMCTHSAHMCWKYPSGLRAHGPCALPRTHRAQMCTAETHRAHPRTHVSSENHGHVWAPDSFGDDLQFSIINVLLFSLCFIFFMILLFYLN